jgi:tRNA-dihydrouridine synthase C
MEGVVDWVMRDLLTQVGGIDQVVTEFLRVTDTKYPDHVFYRNCPELRSQSKTTSGTPVYLQILGGQPLPMAWNALRASELGASGIDINFGCPAKTVNRHDGGASILKCSKRVYEITNEVRKMVPQEVPVTVKIRLGFDSPRDCLENAKAIEDAGATRITVHCRTKTDGYKPPAFWEWIPKIKERVKIPIVVNGEIWTKQDFETCRAISGCTDFMIGRGALANPFIFREIKGLPADENQTWKNLMLHFFDLNQNLNGPKFAMIRCKQWMSAIAFKNLEAKNHFNQIKILTDPELFRTQLAKLANHEVSLTENSTSVSCAPLSQSEKTFAPSLQ